MTKKNKKKSSLKDAPQDSPIESIELEASGSEDDELIDLSDAEPLLATSAEEATADFSENIVGDEDVEDEGLLSELSGEDDDDAMSEFKDYESLDEEYPEDELDASSDDDNDGRLTPKERRVLEMTLEARVESVLFASQKPLKAAEIHEILGDETLEVEHVETTLLQLVDFYANRCGGFRLHYLKRLGFQLQTSDSAGAIMERMFASRPRPISRAALETLAIIAYRQPVTRAEVEFIRGVDAGSIFKTLLERDLIKCTGRKEIVGRPMLFCTSDDFLKVFNLSSIKDLPPLESFQPAREMVQGAMERISDGPDDMVDIEQYISANTGGEDLETPSLAGEDVETAEVVSEEIVAKEVDDIEYADLLDSVADDLHGVTDREKEAARTFGASKAVDEKNLESALEPSNPAEDIDGTDSDTEVAFSDGNIVPERGGDLDQ